MAPRLVAERLWLARQDAEVFIPEEFVQHVEPFQRDGVRFLYAQHSKKNPGVILNDPSDYGKTVQCVLFIEAVRDTTRPSPTLVLCDEDKIQHWRYHFHLWTNSANDTLDDGSNIFSKKEIFIHSVSNIMETSRRQWGVVVIDTVSSVGKSVSLVKQLKSVKGNFKIWLSNENLLNNLANLSTMYEWLNPKETFNANSFCTSGLSPKEQVSKEIQLDVFCQNVLLRRTNEDVKVDKKCQRELFENWIKTKILNRNEYFKTTSSYIPTTTAKIVPTDPIEGPKVSRKNKDATGLKIKRSKPTPETTAETSEAKKRRVIIANNAIDMSDIGSGCLSRKPPPNLTVMRLRREMQIPDSVNSEKNTRPQENDIEKFKDSICTFNNVPLSDKKVGFEISTNEPNQNKSEQASGKGVITEPKTSNIDKCIENAEEAKHKINIVKESVSKYENLTKESKVVEDEEKEKPGSSNQTLRKEDNASQLHSAVRKIEEMTNKQFKGSLLDNLF